MYIGLFAKTNLKMIPGNFKDILTCIFQFRRPPSSPKGAQMPKDAKFAIMWKNSTYLVLNASIAIRLPFDRATTILRYGLPYPF